MIYRCVKEIFRIFEVHNTTVGTRHALSSNNNLLILQKSETTLHYEPKATEAKESTQQGILEVETQPGEDRQV